MPLKRTCTVLLVALLASGCFKKPDQENMAVQTTASVIAYAAGVNSSYLVAQGPCKGNTSVIFTYSSSATTSNTVEVKCVYDYVNTNLPIQAGTTSQVFTVLVYGRFQNKRAAPSSLTVNFNPSPAPAAGSTVNVAGGQAAGPFASTWDIVGEFFGVPGTQTAALVTHRTGLSGVLDP